jgi:SAM-dependent methyltransferase
MGRFASTAQFYRRYREPYAAEFFRAVAARLRLTGQERLVDAGCGPAPLAIGFAPFVGSSVGVDPEPKMIADAKVAAGEAGVRIELLLGRIEDAGESLGSVDLVTIGRALHWLPREGTLAVLDRVLARNGRIAVCWSVTSEASINRWAGTLDRIQRPWSSDPHGRRYRIRPDAWFDGSRFRKAGEIAVAQRRVVKIEDLIGRALSRSTTSPAVLGSRRPGFERALREGLKEFAIGGVLREEIVTRAIIFQ